MTWWDDNEARKNEFATMLNGIQEAPYHEDDNATEMEITSALLEESPRFIGHGDPTSRVLFIGKELAFDPRTVGGRNHLRHELHPNRVFWNSFMSPGINGWGQPQNNLNNFWGNWQGQNTMFNPMIPQRYFPPGGKTDKENHTWGKYSKVLFVDGQNRGYLDHLRERNSWDLAFSHYCFLTEWNPIPGKTHARAKQLMADIARGNNITARQLRMQLSAQREKHLDNPYYRSFTVTIASGADFMPGRKYNKGLMRVMGFNGYEVDRVQINVRDCIFTHQGRSLIIVGNQLSGSGLVSDERIQALNTAIQGMLEI